jgi:hypothetical protein
MKLALQRRVPRDYNPQVFTEIVREIEMKVNLLVEERLAAFDNALTSVPTTGDWARGDFVRNSTPSEAGSALSKYVIIGWVCVTAGTPGTWKECRFLTGN